MYNNMNFYTSVPEKLTPFYKSELDKYEMELKNSNLKVAWNHLERAHIIVQKYPIAHTEVHWKMLLFAIKIKNRKEIVGQIPRLVFGGIKSFVGSIPTGNPGGSNVPPLKSFPINDELKEIFYKAGIK
jgi:Protein of unknown function (DUF3703)